MKPSMVVRAVPASNGKTRLEIAGNPFFEVNAVAPTIWAKLVDGLSTQEIIDHLVRQFGVPEERVSSDVGNFIAILKEHLLISDDPELALAGALLTVAASFGCHSSLTSGRSVDLTSLAAFSRS